jgi:MoxR-like ATPase
VSGHVLIGVPVLLSQDDDQGRVAPGITSFASAFAELSQNIEKVVLGKPDQVAQALICLLAGGHLLVEDVPGVGKTSLARCIAGSVDGTCRRIQFTPDLLPSDITGVTIYRQQLQDFEFRPGPVFANLVICDEINRASPKTQAALLEVMEEHQVSADGVTYPVPSPFMVVATQNPIDLDGTYPLPEAQVDRFLLRLSMGYPDEDTELDILRAGSPSLRAQTVSPVLTRSDILAMMETAAQAYVSDEIRRYIVRVVAATRKRADVHLGASPRGSLALLRASQVRAASQGRDFVIPEDVQGLAVPVLAHRLVLSSGADLRAAADEAIQDLLCSIPVPRSRARV